MLSKTIIATAALAAGVAATSADDFPVCWATCFAEYDIKSEDCLCKDSLKDVVSACIAAGCESADTESYEAWLSSYCYVTPVSSNTWAVPSSVVPVPSSYPVPEPSSYVIPVYSTDPVPSYTYPAPEPSSSAAPAPSSYDPSVPYYPSTSCSTLVWSRCTSIYATGSYAAGGSYPVATGTGAYGGGSWVSGTWVAATGTGAVYPTASAYDPVPATGAAAKTTKLAGVSFAVAGLIAGVAAVLL